MRGTVLGLDIGGANVKAATSDGRAVSVPFALWKAPDRLPAILAEVIAKFAGADEVAVTMTGELCDCFRTKRDGVAAILDAVLAVADRRRVRVWSTAGAFVNVDAAKADYLAVAAANWHALATFVGRYVAAGPAVLVDIGSTTTDIIPLRDGVPVPVGRTDPERMKSGELIYTGVRRTPAMALLGNAYAAELFATSLDAYVLLGMMEENETDTDTADGRPATRANSHARLSRMMCGDPELTSTAETAQLALLMYRRQFERVSCALTGQHPAWSQAIISGSGEVLARDIFLVLNRVYPEPIFLSHRLGAERSTAAPACAVATLAAESRIS